MKKKKKHHGITTKRREREPTWKHCEEVERRVGGMAVVVYGGPRWDGDSKAAWRRERQGEEKERDREKRETEREEMREKDEMRMGKKGLCLG